MNHLQMEMDRAKAEKIEFIGLRKETLSRLKSMKTTIDNRHLNNQKTNIAASALGVTGAVVGFAAPFVGIPLAVAAGAYRYYSSCQTKSFEEDTTKEINEVLERDRQISERLKKSSEDIVSHMAAGATAASCAATATVSAVSKFENVRQLNLLGREVFKYSNSVSATSTLASRTIMHSFVVLSVTIDLYQLYKAVQDDTSSELAKGLQEIILALEKHQDEEISNLDQLIEECQRRLTEERSQSACCILM